MTLLGYFDESGDPRDPNVHAFVIAGAIADDAAWELLSQQWSKILDANNLRDRKGVQWFHSKDLRHGHGAFEGWNPSRRAGLFERLRAVIRAHVQLVVAAYDVFDEASPMTLEQQYLAAHEYVIQQSVADLATKGEMLGSVNFVFAKRPEVNPIAHHTSLCQYLRATAPLLPREIRASYSRIYETIGALRLSDPRISPELQAADLIVSDVYQWLRTRNRELPETLRSRAVPFVLRQIQWFRRETGV